MALGSAVRRDGRVAPGRRDHEGVRPLAARATRLHDDPRRRCRRARLARRPPADRQRGRSRRRVGAVGLAGLVRVVVDARIPLLRAPARPRARRDARCTPRPRRTRLAVRTGRGGTAPRRRLVGQPEHHPVRAVGGLAPRARPARVVPTHVARERRRGRRRRAVDRLQPPPRLRVPRHFRHQPPRDVRATARRAVPRRRARRLRHEGRSALVGAAARTRPHARALGRGERRGRRRARSMVEGPGPAGRRGRDPDVPVPLRDLHGHRDSVPLHPALLLLRVAVARVPRGPPVRLARRCNDSPRRRWCSSRW